MINTNNVIAMVRVNVNELVLIHVELSITIRNIVNWKDHPVLHYKSTNFPCRRLASQRDKV